MDFTWSAEQDAYRMDVRKWLEANRPQSLARGEDNEAGGDDAIWQRLKAWHKKLYHAGWAGLTWPRWVASTAMHASTSRPWRCASRRVLTAKAWRKS